MNEPSSAIQAIFNAPGARVGALSGVAFTAFRFPSAVTRRTNDAPCTRTVGTLFDAGRDAIRTTDAAIAAHEEAMTVTRRLTTAPLSSSRRGRDRRREVPTALRPIDRSPVRVSAEWYRRRRVRADTRSDRART